MKRKIILLLLSSALSLSACGSSNDMPAATDQSNSENTESVSEDGETEISDLESFGKIDVDKQIFDVKITIPSDYVGEQTQEDLDKIADEHGFQSIVLNADGSATYTMTKQQHEDFLAEYRGQINNSLNEMIASQDYPNFTEITANDNFTEFTVTTKSTELDMNESFSVMAFYMYGGFYNILSGENVDNVSVIFVNSDTGDVISTSNSKDTQ